MITRKVIDTLYRRHRRPPRRPLDEQLNRLVESLGTMHSLRLDNGWLEIGSLDPMSPFRRIMTKRIHAIVPFDRSVAIVLPSSILFLNKRDPGVSLHFKPNPVSFWQKLRWWLHRG